MTTAFQAHADTHAAQERARQRRAATRRNVGQHVAEGLRDYNSRAGDLQRVAELGAEPPADLVRLVDVAEAIKPLADQAADQAAAAPPTPDPADTFRQLLDGTDTQTVAGGVQRGLTKAAVAPAADTHWDAVLVTAQAAAARAITAARPATLIQALQKPHSALCERVTALVREHPPIAALNDAQALRASRAERDAYLDAAEALAALSRIEAYADELRGQNKYQQAEDFWDGLDEQLLKRFRQTSAATLSLSFGSWPGQQSNTPRFLDCLAAGATRRLPTRAELQATIAARGAN